MSSVPIAAQLPSAMYTPLVILIVVYAAFNIMAGRARGKENRAQAERFSTWAFAVALVAGLYVLVLLIAAAVSYPNRIYDMLIILVVVGVFFAALLYAFLLIAELIPRSLRRGDDR
jgi:small neutral amino acid transporter SnatA (MarC family)